MMGFFKVCTRCEHDRLNGRFSIHGSDRLSPGAINSREVADLLVEGWTVTYHDHDAYPCASCGRTYRHPQVAWTDPETGQHHLEGS